MQTQLQKFEQLLSNSNNSQRKEYLDIIGQLKQQLAKVEEDKRHSEEASKSKIHALES